MHSAHDTAPVRVSYSPKMRVRARFRRAAFWVVVVTTLRSGAARADGTLAPRARPALRADAELEYYFPTKSDRPIRTVFANVVIGVPVLHEVLVLEAGLTATGAWGSITQWNERFVDVRYDTGVVGAGPIFLVRCEPVHLGRFALSLDALGGVVFYSAAFPPGGDVYNFTWRLGGAFLVRVTEPLSISVGTRWMHVSNGQGLNPHNPSYEGIGFSVGISYRF
jgi:hypothetical protein